eukprot:jgi/Psemu1/25626/gm1.25626_g
MSSESPTTITPDQELLEQQRQWLLEKIPSVPSPLPDDFLSTLTKLELPNLGLNELPSCLPELCPNLSILFCPKNNFLEVPEVIGRCPNLQMVSFKECQTIERIHPEALQPQLRWLILTGNKISELPDTIGRCTKLQKCMLSGNKIRKLPDAAVLSKLQNLELIRLACNQLEAPPTALLESCPNLRWAAFAGNPFLQKARAREEASASDETDDNNNNNNGSTTTSTSDAGALPVLDDPVLDDDSWPVLGRGAGGVTRRVTWQGRDVAVKTFAGELTSDGSPQDEKDISKRVVTAAGSEHKHEHEPALIELLGETKEGGALVMEFLDGYKALAGPPSMSSCSRDVYSDDDREALFSSVVFPLWKIATDTLRVLAKLHALGITHADFYAHNILIRPGAETETETEASVKVSDFGAAFRYRYNDNNNNNNNNNNESALSEFGRLVERVEVRAYAVLVAELHELAKDGTMAEQSDEPWEELLDACGASGATFGALAERFRA